MLDELLSDLDDGDFILTEMKHVSDCLVAKVDENLKVRVCFLKILFLKNK